MILIPLLIHFMLCYLVYRLCRSRGYDVPVSALLGFFWCIGLVVALLSEKP